MKRFATVMVCPHCEGARLYSTECSFCNTPLFETKVELPEMSSSEREAAENFLVMNRTGDCQSQMVI